MPPLNFISSGRSVRKRLPLEKFLTTHIVVNLLQALPSFHVISRMSTLEIVLGSKR